MTKQLTKEKIIEVLNRRSEVVYRYNLMIDMPLDLRNANLRFAVLSRADLRFADLSRANLRSAVLSRANLRDADLSGADLILANLIDADLRGADLSRANLRSAVLRGAVLSRADLRGANLRGANLRGADLRDADLRGANLRDANLRDADLSGADLSDADLRGANLRGADLRGADLSGCKGLISATEWLLANFEDVGDHFLVYKSFGQYYTSPESWEIKPGSVIVENGVNPDRGTDCGSGINFATLGWLKGDGVLDDAIWVCRLDKNDLVDTVVPFSTDGKARCRRLTLLHKHKGE